MPEVNYYLKKAGKSLIYLQFKYFKKRLVFTFKESIEPANWNSKKQRVKSTSSVTNDGKFLINDLLDNLQAVCTNAYNREISKGIPVPQVIKKSLNDFLNYNIIEDDRKAAMPTLSDLMARFCAGEIKFRGKDKAKGSLQNYSAVRKHLEEFALKEKYPLNFENISLDFFYQYIGFLKKKGLAHNTISKDISILKVFMGEAVDLGYSTNLQFKHKKFSMPEVDVDACYLKEAEIMKLYQHDFSHCKRLEKVRDLFVFGCYVGLRYSDYSRIKPEHIIEIDQHLYIKMVTQKTKNPVIIPLENPIILEILAKYKHMHNQLPKSMTDVNFNKYIKEAAKLAGLDESGRVAHDPTKKLWELIASHTARRSFATNYYLDGFPPIDLMKITSHTTERSFLKYIKISKLDTANRLQKHIQKNLSRYVLKIV